MADVPARHTGRVILCTTMRKVLLPLAGAGVLLAGLSAQAIPQGPTTINSDQAGVRYGAPTFIQSGLPTQTARAVSQGFFLRTPCCPWVAPR